MFPDADTMIKIILSFFAAEETEAQRGGECPWVKRVSGNYRPKFTDFSVLAKRKNIKYTSWQLSGAFWSFS